MLCISFFVGTYSPGPFECPPRSLAKGSFARGLRNPCADTLQPVSKTMHSARPSGRFADPDHSEFFHEVTKSIQEQFTDRKTAK